MNKANKYNISFYNQINILGKLKYLNKWLINSLKYFN